MRIGAEAGRASFGAALRCSVAAALMAAGCMQPLAAARAAPAPSAFAAFVSGLWPEAERVGIPRATFDAAFATLTPDPSLAPLIRAQPEFSKPIGTYLAAQVTPARIAAGHAALARWHAALDGIAVRTGVPPAIVVAVWGLETNYGAAAGSKDVIRSLATLGALGWRPELMRSEIVAALTLIKDGDATRAQLRGSWAGAMGQPQFMPSSFAKYAVDGDGDGRRDIWTDVPDALASIANFLKQQGWQAGQPWGFEVRLPPGFDVGQSHGSFADWAARGLARPDGGAFPAQGDATLFFPAGAAGPGSDTLIILPVRDTVLFPGTVFPIALGRSASIAAAQQAVREEKQIGILMQRDAATGEPSAGDLHSFGTVANVLRYISTPDGQHHVVVQGESRFQVEGFLQEQPFFRARVRAIVEPEQRSPDIEARFMNLKRMALEALQLLPQAPSDLVGAVQNAASPSQLTDLVAAYLDFPTEQKQELIETIDPVARIDKVVAILAHRLEVLRLTAEIGRQTKATFDERQKEAVLREQMAAIQRQLGEGDAGRAQEVADLSAAIDKARMPADADASVRKELRRYERSSDASPESGMIRNHLDWMVELPWGLPEEAPIDIAEARRVLDADHFGLKKIKDRIVEYLAVRKLAPNGKAPILCFAGPPGVGKTSLGQSIARAMGRPFVRVSLGGVHDEAEIRGHRSTYIGALPGNIVQGLRKAGARNCVMMLDEIDKMGRGVGGDPSAAMLEVLDPEQNGTFRDNYIGTPFDLSRVVFIATANMLDTIPGPLRDRMEIITLAGYTRAEKLEIARRYLVRRQTEANGLKPDQVELGDEALGAVIGGYTREAGVRNLEREVGSVMRHAAVRIASGEAERVAVTPDDLPAILGPTRFESEVGMRTGVPGVATGLAWTPVGGEILFIEATRAQGRGSLMLTGQLGDVMKESAQIALSLVKGRAGALGIDPKALDGADIHVHVPAGATPKDGPSAGVAMTMALVSLLSGRPVRHDTAMTGEVSLRGLVLPVGGIKEKVIAAAAAGITRVMLPARNRRDYDDIPADVRDALKFTWLERVDDAVAGGLEAAAGVEADRAA